MENPVFADGTTVTGDGTSEHPLATIASGSAGTATKLGFFGTTPTTKQTVTGSKGGNAALASLMTALVAYGIVIDTTS